MYANLSVPDIIVRCAYARQYTALSLGRLLEVAPELTWFCNAEGKLLVAAYLREEISERDLLTNLAFHLKLEALARESLDQAERKKGNCDAQYLLSRYYCYRMLDGSIDARSPEKQYYWLNMSARNGHAHAHYILGLRILYDPFEKDKNRAREHLQHATDYGHSNAPYILFRFLEKGNLALLRIAVERGCIEAREYVNMNPM